MLIYKMDDISIMTLSRKEIPNYFFYKVKKKLYINEVFVKKFFTKKLLYPELASSNIIIKSFLFLLIIKL